MGVARNYGEMVSVMGRPVGRTCQRQVNLGSYYAFIKYDAPY